MEPTMDEFIRFLNRNYVFEEFFRYENPGRLYYLAPKVFRHAYLEEMKGRCENPHGPFEEMGFTEEDGIWYDPDGKKVPKMGMLRTVCRFYTEKDWSDDLSEDSSIGMHDLLEFYAPGMRLPKVGDALKTAGNNGGLNEEYRIYLHTGENYIPPNERW